MYDDQKKNTHELKSYLNNKKITLILGASQAGKRTLIGIYEKEILEKPLPQ